MIAAVVLPSRKGGAAAVEGWGSATVLATAPALPERPWSAAEPAYTPLVEFAVAEAVLPLATGGGADGKSIPLSAKVRAVDSGRVAPASSAASAARAAA